MTDSALTEAGRVLVGLLAELLMALDPARRERVGERALKNYRDEFAKAHPEAGFAAADEAALQFGGALLWKWNGCGLVDATHEEAGHA